MDAIRRAAIRCRTSRDRLIDRVDAEAHAVRIARETVAEIRAVLADTPAHGALASNRCARLRLGRLRVRCDDLARRRREHLGDDVEGFETGSNAPSARDDPHATAQETAADGGGDDGGAGDADVDRDDGGLQPGELQSLCYRGLATDRPVLAVVDALRGEIERRRRSLIGGDR